jgi:hypothetical protein
VGDWYEVTREPVSRGYGSYEAGNYAAAGIAYRVRAAWDWVCGFFGYMRGNKL